MTQEKDQNIRKRIVVSPIPKTSIDTNQIRKKFPTNDNSLFSLPEKKTEKEAFSTNLKPSIEKKNESISIEQKIQTQKTSRRKSIIVESKTAISQPHNSFRNESHKVKNIENFPHGEEEQKKDTKKEEVKRQPNEAKPKPITLKTGHEKKVRTIKVSGIGKKGLEKAKITMQSTLDAQNDAGASTVSYGISGASGAVKAVAAAEKGSDFIIKNTPRTLKIVKSGAVGAYKIGKTTIKVVKSIDSTIGMVRTGAILLNRDTMDRLRIMAAHRILNSNVAQRIIQGVRGIKRTVIKGASAIKTGAVTTKKYVVKLGKGVVRTAVLAQGLLYGTIKIRITKQTIASIAKKTIPVVGKSVLYTAKTSGKILYRGGKIIIPTTFRGGVKLVKGVSSGVGMLGDTLINSNSFEAKTTGFVLKSAHYTVKGIGYTPKVAKVGYKGVKTTVKTVYKGGRFLVKTGVGTYRYVKTGIKISKRMGVKKTLKMYSKRWARSFKGKLVKGLKKAGGSVVNASFDLIKKIGAKVILPLLIIIIAVGIIGNVVNGIAGSVNVLLSPFSSDEHGTEIDETEWLKNKISQERAKLVNDIKREYRNNNVAHGGRYHYVRFYDAMENVEIDLTDSNIETCIYSAEEYLHYIEPIFHTIMISEYELSASESQMTNVFKRIWNDLTSISKVELPTEYCHMTLTYNADGTYDVTPVKEPDGTVHASMIAGNMCMNHGDLKYHSGTEAFYVGDITCDCDYYYWKCWGHKGVLICDYKDKEEHVHTGAGGSCYGYVCGKQHSNPFAPNYHIFRSSCWGLTCGYDYSHRHTDWTDMYNTGCYDTNFCSYGDMVSACSNSERKFKCRGWYECKGHKVLKIVIDVKGLGELLDKYYIKEIKRLENKASLTADEQEKLEELRDYYDLCLQYINVLAEDYGIGSTTVTSLDSVTLTPFTRAACSFIGYPFLRGGNNPSTGTDSDGFVQYCFANYAAVSLPRKACEQVKCGSEVASIEDALPGDLIFWSGNGTDEGVYHVAIYLGNDLIIHASNSAAYPQGGIKVSKLYGTLYKIRRLY